MAASVSLSTADVASSRMRTGASLSTARPGPSVAAGRRTSDAHLHPPGSVAVGNIDEGVGLGCLAAATTSSSLASGRPYRMFSITLVETGSRVVHQGHVERREAWTILEGHAHTR